MLLGFKRRFAEAVETGAKTHTIRTRIPSVGEIAHCYVDPRQRTMRLLGRWQITRTETIVISRHGNVYLAPRPLVQEWLKESPLKAWGFVRLTPDEIDAFAKADGFPGGAEEFLEYWDDYGRLPFMGYVIHWAYTQVAA